MRLKTSAALGLILAGTLVVAACGKSTSTATSSSSSSAGASSSEATGSAMASGSGEATGSAMASGSSSAPASGCGTASSGSGGASSAAESSAASGSAAAGGGTASKVGVILPDTKSSARWETADRPFLEAAFKAAGVSAQIQNAQGSASTMATIADQMITSGVKVLAIVNLDNSSGAAIEKKAAAQGVKTLDYDRHTLGGSAEAYISFDNTKVGELQGQGLADALGSGDKNIVYLNGSPDDSNATAFAKGAHNILDKITSYKVVAEQAVPKWDNQQAATIFEQMFTKQGGKIDGVLAANDGLGNAAIGVLKKNGVTIPVTGQDATVQGLQNILDGTQCMTVYKAVKKEAGALAEAAIALASGGKVATTGTDKDTQTGKDTPAILLTPEAITLANVSDPVKDGFVKASDVCTGEYAAKCSKAGIS